MPRTVRDVPPPLELACLSALWTLEEANVRAVQEIVARQRPLAYTTIMTVLDRLVRKGKLTRRKLGRSFVYAPSQSRDSLRRAAVRELVDGYFDGSEAQLIAFLQNTPVHAAPAAPLHSDPEPQIDAALL
jgi:BlaI family transcriptional regulator, penicillinase repressor